MIVDITQSFFSMLPPQQPSSQPSSYNSQQLISIEAELCYRQSNDILHNIQKIQQILQNTKQNYFSNAAYSYSAFTDQQRNQFDKEMKYMIDGVNIKISEMNDVVKNIRFQSTTEKEHLSNIVICLYQKYRKGSDLFREYLEFNQNRKKKIQSMIGNQIKQAYKTYQPVPVPEIRELPLRKSDPDPELQRQSHQIYEQRMSQQKKIEDTKKTLQQINGMLQIMENKVLEQELLTSSFREIGQIGLFHIQKGNKNLVDANTLAKDSGRLWTMFFLILAFSLLILDYLKS